MKRNAIISLCLGFVLPIYFVWAVSFQFPGPGWLGIAVTVLCPLATAFFGHAALRFSDGSTSGYSALARTGITMGYGELFLAGLIVFSSGHHPNRIVAYESSAVGSLRTLNSAVRAYATNHPRGFPARLDELASDKSEPKTVWNVDSTLATGVRLGYRFTYVAKSTNGDGVVDAYQIFADPLDPEGKEMRHFFTDQTQTIRCSKEGRASKSSPAI